MYDLQTQLDKRLAELRQQKQLVAATGQDAVNRSQIRDSLREAGILTREGKLRKLKLA